MYKVRPSKKFTKSIDKLIKNGLKQKYIDEVYLAIHILSLGEQIGPEYRDHKLNGEYKEYRECHIQGDLLLVYQIIKGDFILLLIDIGSHSDIF